MQDMRPAVVEVDKWSLGPGSMGGPRGRYWRFILRDSSGVVITYDGGFGTKRDAVAAGISSAEYRDYTVVHTYGSADG